MSFFLPPPELVNLGAARALPATFGAGTAEVSTTSAVDAPPGHEIVLGRQETTV